MADNISRLVLPRAVRPAPSPLGLYFRPGWNEHKDILTALETGKTGFFGAVLDPARMHRQKELRDRVIDLRLDAILDPRTQASATPGGYNDDLGALPWGVGRQHTRADFQGEFQRRKIVAPIGDFAVDQGFTAVLSPTHVIQSANDPWLSIDAASVRFLRNHLDRKHRSIPIFYSLALSVHAFRDPDQRQAIIQALTDLPISALWLKVESFGSHASPTAARIYIEALTDFHQLGIPIIADHVGGLIGLSLLAFGSAGGLAHGITSGERFSAKGWMKPKKEGATFSAAKRVYLPGIDLLLKPIEAKALLESSPRSRAMFGCTNPECCPRGVTDMLQNPGRHFICQRIEEVGGLSVIPANLRTQRFLDQHVRSTTDKALTAANIKWTDPAMAKKTQEHRKRLDNLRIALGTQAAEHPPQSFSAIPRTRSARES